MTIDDVIGEINEQLEEFRLIEESGEQLSAIQAVLRIQLKSQLIQLLQVREDNNG